MENVEQTLPQALTDFLERLRVDTIIGTPQERGEVTVIPVAELSARLGYGFGHGEGTGAGQPDGLPEGTQEGEGDADPVAMVASGSGGGAGGTASVTPRGYIELTASAARWVPIMDERRTAQAGMALAAWVMFWLLYTVRSIAGQRAKRPA